MIGMGTVKMDKTWVGQFLVTGSGQNHQFMY